jgi:hypothetical protein
MTEENVDEDVRGSLLYGSRQRDQQCDPSVNSVPIYKSLNIWPRDSKTHEDILRRNFSQTNMPGQFVLVRAREFGYWLLEVIMMKRR